MQGGGVVDEAEDLVEEEGDEEKAEHGLHAIGERGVEVAIKQQRKGDEREGDLKTAEPRALSATGEKRCEQEEGEHADGNREGGQDAGGC